MKVFIILNTQLFEDIDLLQDYDKIIIVRDEYYFKESYHLQKLVYYRASIEYYYDYLKYNLSKPVKILDEIDDIKDNDSYYMYDPIDWPLRKKYKYCTFLNSPLFLESGADLKNFYKSENGEDVEKFTHSSFYAWNRKRLNVLMNGSKPVNGKWSFDFMNRNKFDKNYEEMDIKIYNNPYISNAKKYYKTNIDLYYSTTHEEAKKNYQKFLKYKLSDFGKFQDSISKDVIFGNHSIISVHLNTGLLSVKYVIKEVLKYKNKVNYESLEGFIRQIIGWRAYMRLLYECKYKQMKAENYFGFKKKLNKSWFSEIGIDEVNNRNKDDQITDIELLDHMILKVRKYAYLHHIERLMIVSNISLMLEFDPKDIYKWFMDCFIDANSEWVMMGNVFVMGQSANSSFKAMNRVYISSGNYIKKMSDFKNKNDFDKIDNIYRSFLKNNKTKLKNKSDYVLNFQLSKIK